MADTIDIRIEGQHGSINSDVEWLNVPTLAILSGINGAGKSQLLEVIAYSLGAWRPPSAGRMQPPVDLNARAKISGLTVSSAEVVYLRSDWPSISAGQASWEGIKQQLSSIRGRLDSNEYSQTVDVARDNTLRALGLSSQEVRALSPQAFLIKMTPSILWKWFAASGGVDLSLLFLAYRIVESELKRSGETESAIESLLGQAPWNSLNSVLEESAMPYQVNYPESCQNLDRYTNETFTMSLRDVERDVMVPFSGLSAGERVIISLASWRYQAESIEHHSRLMLLDEPDAHLHPSMVRTFLDILGRVFVDKRGTRVIMTTHSPSTVALAPEGSLFEMNRTPPRIIPATSKAALISKLTDGFVTVQEATRTVFVEGKTDVPFYQLMWELLTSQPDPQTPATLPAYPNLHFVNGCGKTTVQLVVPQMRAKGLDTFFGMIDLDAGNAPEIGVHVLKRYSIENYLLDPLCVWFVLHQSGAVNDLPGVVIKQGAEADVRHLNQVQLQSIADFIFTSYEQKFPRSLTDSLREAISFTNGVTLQYPKWLLRDNGKELRPQFCEVFGYLHIKDEKLLRALNVLEMVPHELLGIFERIQAGLVDAAPIAASAHGTTH